MREAGFVFDFHYIKRHDWHLGALEDHYKRGTMDSQRAFSRTDLKALKVNIRLNFPKEGWICYGRVLVTGCAHVLGS